MSAMEVYLEVLPYINVDGSDRMKFRLGVYLDELDLTERHSTAIPTIQNCMEINGMSTVTVVTNDGRILL